MSLELDMTAAGGYLYFYGITPWFNVLEDKEICKYWIFTLIYMILNDFCSFKRLERVQYIPMWDFRSKTHYKDVNVSQF